MARRLAWSQLDPTYRRRLQRAGITAESHREGANLQSARGQTIEARRTAIRKRIPGAASQSTIRKYRRKALDAGVRPEDWDAALASTGVANFDAIKHVVNAKEQAHQQWTAAGSHRRTRYERQNEPSYIQDTIGTVELVRYPDLDLEGLTNDELEELDDALDDMEIDYYSAEDIAQDWGESWSYYH